ncbi:MAG: phenylalanine--tRNA ligase subunit beta [Burkholderiaceae bacterium]
MQLSESWLRAFVDPDLSTDELAHALTMRGLEVEDVSPVAPPFTGIVVGEVLEVAKHPDADRLSVCKVRADDGGGLLTIVCGAPNVAPGIKVPLAMIGAVLPPAKQGDAPFEIKRATMRGVASEGMLCSARELKLSDDHAGLLILPADTKVGATIREVLDLDDHVFTLKLTPNKGDCLSALGVAREVAALSGKPLREPSYAPVSATITDTLPVSITAPELCGRWSGRIMRGVNARAQTPAWMKARLERSGQRSVSALVDISNYVMLEVGRPTHVFDLDKIHGSLTVRWAHQGETLKLLNGETVTLAPDVGVIADMHAIESMAGIMGGDATAVSLDTTDIYLEAAFWWPEALQGRARRYGFSTDAAYRFERGVDYATTVEHIERITRLVLDICGSDATRVGPVDDHVVNLPLRASVRMRVARAAKVIGVPIGADEIDDIFTAFGFAFSRAGKDDDEVFLVTPPSHRFDLEIEEDLIEEVARGHGYENIPAHLPVARHVMHAQPEATRGVHALADAIAARGYREALNFSFVEAAWERDFADNDNPIRLLNPIAAPLAVMRSSLIGSLVANVRFNMNRKATRVRMFEIAKVYVRDASIPDGPLSVAGIAQPLKVAAIAWGPVWSEQWGASTRAVDFFDVKADVEALFAALGPDATPTFIAAEHPALHPGRSARIESRGRAVGFIGELHPRWLQDYELPSPAIVFEVEAQALMQACLPEIAPISRYPTVVRDLALIVDASLPVGQVAAAIEATLEDRDHLVRNFALFDQYRGKGLNENEKSLAFRFWLQDTRQTLDEAAIEAAMQRLITALGKSVGARLRQ